MMEPRSGLSVWGGVELGLVSAATVQIGHRYGLPVNVYGLSTNAHVMDIQNGMERAVNALLPALAGADELSGVGEIEAGVMGSYAQMVCDGEIVAAIRRLRQGLSVKGETLAVEVVESVMDSSRSFLSHRHTSTMLRAGEMFIPQLADRLSWDAWERGGREGMAERAQVEAERLLAEHLVPPLTDDQDRELSHILIEAQAVLGKD
jgi:trimethylamine--corrinoid protein Co-methyltransferase